jgi:hypothetical protein
VALLEATPGKESADNLIVLFTDGKSSCVSATGFSDPLFSSGTITTDADGKRLRCTENTNYFTVAIDEEIATYSSNLRDNNITLHVILAGKTVRPHTLLYPSADGCLSDEAVRKLDPPANYVSWGARGAGTPRDFPYANRYYELANTTGGFFLPVRDPCTDPRANLQGAPDNDLSLLEEDLNRACYDNRSLAGQPLPQSRLNSSLRSLVDSEGRLLCDPSGDSKTDQIIRAVEKIMSESPFMLVN